MSCLGHLPGQPEHSTRAIIHTAGLLSHPGPGASSKTWAGTPGREGILLQGCLTAAVVTGAWTLLFPPSPPKVELGLLGPEIRSSDQSRSRAAGLAAVVAQGPLPAATGQALAQPCSGPGQSQAPPSPLLTPQQNYLLGSEHFLVQSRFTSTFSCDPQNCLRSPPSIYNHEC